MKSSAPFQWAEPSLGGCLVGPRFHNRARLGLRRHSKPVRVQGCWHPGRHRGGGEAHSHNLPLRPISREGQDHRARRRWRYSSPGAMVAHVRGNVRRWAHD